VLIMVEKTAVHHLIAALHAQDARTRDKGAAELGDLVEAGQLDEHTFKLAVRTLLHTALAETDSVARESMFHALSTAAAVAKTWKIDWKPLAARLDDLEPDCLEYALVILGFSGDPHFSERIAPYQTHADEAIRVAATEALRMLGAPEARPRMRAGNR
jgi:hypothetical protein